MFIRRILSKDKSDEFSAPFLVVGLGNPGREYRETRHNIGFMVVDQVAAAHGMRLMRVQNRALISIGKIAGEKVILAKPQTFMNISGTAVGGLVNFYKIPLSNLIVIHDDLDLPFGMMRLRPSGGSAGQKGVRSIIDRLGSEDFSRLRIGIGRPASAKHGADYVLRGFYTSEKEELPFILKRAAEAVEVFLSEGIDQAMNRFNGPQEGR